MSPTLTNPALDRSSVTPPQPPPAQGRVGPRMKPQSERLKRDLREAHPLVVQRAREYVEDQKRQSRIADNPKNRPVWMELDSDDAGAGPLDKDDTVYQGRSGRSRIASVQSSRDGAIHTRRSRARERASPDIEPPPPAQRHGAQRLQEREGDPDGDTAIGAERSKGRKKKTYKTPSIVISSEDEAQEVPSSEGPGLGKREREEALEALRYERKKHRSNRPVYDWPMTRTPTPPSPRPVRRRSLPPPPPLVAEPELPSLLEIMNEELGGPELFDDEAMESGGEEVSLQGTKPRQDGDAPSPNEYNLDDPFINDEEESSASDSSSSTVPRSTKRPKSSLSSPFKLAPKPKKPQLDDGLSSESDDSADEHGEVVLRRLSKGTPAKLWSSSTAASGLEGPSPTTLTPSYEVTWAAPQPSPTPVETPLKPRPRPVPKKTPSAHGLRQPQPPSAPNNHAEAGGRELSSSSRGRTKPGDPKEGNKPDKGKGKARVIEEEVEPEVDEGEDLGANLSEMSEWERTQFELAIFNSKRIAPTNSQGESSTQGSSSMSTPRATAMFTSASPALATPEATALFTTPSSNAALRTAPQPPVSPLGNGVPLSMAELVRRSRALAANTAGVDTSALPEASPPSTPTYPVIHLIIRVTESDIPDVDETLQAALQDPIHQETPF